VHSYPLLFFGTTLLWQQAAIWKRACAPGNGLLCAAGSMADSRAEGANSDAE